MPIINRGGHEAVPAQDMCALFGEILGLTPEVTANYPERSQKRVEADNKRRMAITNPCKVHWRDGLGEMAEAHRAREMSGAG
ncbi:hypothetical protein [Novosphingobium pentaromativorans]|uniref:Uncharacterized protein n=1 Tax=Novosphingobium pentaromativorans US6-1 TaxID=1088721 RepID=G6E887_9SPHN|nr:hypothetical protein [Novosphingobium pentaromativorans]AIT81421.1 hypothetical protein JI59_17320 [Novosphingobium pentaromativorans US6-1]EHJ62427.1 hypothetical protein NSU_0558 [Novosphingobium pentaromativorans US6-1]